MAEDLGAIKVGLQVGMGSLDRDLQTIKKKIEPIEREHKIPFSVGKVSFADVQKEIQRVSDRAIPIQLTAAKGSGAKIHRELTAQLRAAGPVPVQIKANLSASEISRIRSEITQAISKTPIPIKVAVTGTAGGGSAAPAAPVAARPVAPSQPAPTRAAPTTPVVASSPATPVPASQRPSTGRTASRTTPPAAPPATGAATPPAQPTPPQAARGSSRAQKATATAASAPERAPRQTVAPTPPASPKPGEWTFEAARKAGNIIDLNTTDEDEVADKLGKPRGGAARYLRRRALRAPATQSGSPPGLTPSTPEEIEYASRPAKVNLPLDEEDIAKAEARGRGARGVHRAGFRRRGERVQTVAEIQQVDKNLRGRNAANARERDKELRDPAHGSAAFYGTSITESDPRLRRQLESLQMFRMSPVIGEAFDLLQSGDVDSARQALRGFGLEMKGADPRKRKKFFRLLRNQEKVPEALLEQSAALDALYTEMKIAIDPQGAVLKQSADYVPSSGKGKQAAGPKQAQADIDLAAANRGEMTFEELTRRHPEFATLGQPRTPFASNVTHIEGEGADAKVVPGPGPAPKKTPRAKYGTIKGGKLVPPEDIGDPTQRPYRFRREQGGPIEGALMRAIREAKEKKEGRYLVGEKRPETYISDRGDPEIIGENGPEVRSFERDGKVVPFVPEWVKRQALNAKDLTRRETGGSVRRKRVPRYVPNLEAEPGSGLAGRKQKRDAFAGERELIAAGGLSPSGGVQRVFVVNWPGGSPIGAGRGQQRGIASNPAAYGGGAGPGPGTETLIADLVKELRRTPRKQRERKEATERPEARPKLSITEQFEAKVAARSGAGMLDPNQIREEMLAIQGGLTEVQQQIPVRALAPAAGQTLATIIGGRGEALQRLRVANSLLDQWKRKTTEYLVAQEKLNKLETEESKISDPAKKEAKSKEIEEQADVTKELAGEVQGLGVKAAVAAKHADSLSLKMRVFSANTVGIIGGTVLFGAALGALQLGMGAVGQAVAPALERMMGFTSTSAAVTKALGEQIKAQGGASESAYAMIAAQSGLSAATMDMIGPLLQQRASIEQNNKTLQLGIDQLHAFEEAQRRGGEQGLRNTTSGLGGTFIGGVASTQELVGRELTSPDVTISQGERELRRKALQGESPRVYQGFSQGGVSQSGFTQLDPDEILAETQGRQDLLQGRLDFFNNAIEKGGGYLKLIADAAPEVADAFAKVADTAGLGEIANAARGDNRIVVVSPDGTPVMDPEKLVKVMRQLNEGQGTADPKVLIRQLTERIIPAQLELFAAQGRYQRELQLPGQLALSQLAAPTAGLTGGPAFEAGLVGQGKKGKTDEAAQAAADKYKELVGGAIKDVNAEIEAGRQALINLVPANLQSEFSTLLDDITATGTAISKIQIGLQQQQTNLQLAEYNNQLRIANRSLKDARDLQAGIAGATKDTLGGIEGQTVALQRQLQLLQFELQQRQINFKLATAGFVAPGTTPEERAANIKAAEKEAEYAQKQLDIQKKLANLSYKGIQITADRNVTDLVRQIGLLEQGRELVYDTSAANRAIDIFNKKSQNLISKAQTYLEEQNKIVAAGMEAASQISQQTGKAFGVVLRQTANAWGIFGEQARAILEALVGTRPVTTNPDGSRVAGGEYASGIVGDTLGPTQITVGEAAGEKVAVLKNPKIVPTANLGLGDASGAGGRASPISITVVVTGNKISDEMDLHALALRVAREVEEGLMQKTSLFGLRR